MAGTVSPGALISVFLARPCLRCGRSRALAHHLVGLMIVTAVPPVMAAFAASQTVRAVLMGH